MSTQVRRLGLIFAMQAVCVGLGFWVQWQFLSSFSERSASHFVWDKISASGDQILAASRAAGSSGVELTRLLDQIHAAVPGQPWQVTLVDADWRVLRTVPDSSVSSAAETPLLWQTVVRDRSADGRLLLGMVNFADGSHAAAAFQLSHSREMVVVHVPLSAVQMTSGQVLSAIPMVLGLSWLWTCTLLGICTYMIGARICDSMKKSQMTADTDTLQKAQSLLRTQDAVIFGLANLAESRDPETGEHLERISLYATTLAESLRSNPKYRDVVDEEFVRLIGTSSALHDIGKVGIEDAILRKPGRLGPEERAEIQKHPIIGSDCLLKIERRLGASNFLHMAREIARSHHEWWNGSGYPDNRIGNEIPIAARIVAIADVYDALATRRVYKPDLPHIACVGFIERGRGTQFDPDLVDAFLEVEQQFRRIAEQYSDIIRPGADQQRDSPAFREHVDAELAESLDESPVTMAARK